jgi:hypothetical protein
VNWWKIGFTRGVCTARAFTSMIQKVGHLPPFNLGQLRFAYSMCARDDEEVSCDLSINHTLPGLAMEAVIIPRGLISPHIFRIPFTPRCSPPLQPSTTAAASLAPLPPSTSPNGSPTLGSLLKGAVHLFSASTVPETRLLSP